MARDIAPTGIITARYQLNISNVDKNGKQSLSRQYSARKLLATENVLDWQDPFIIYVKIGYKLPAIIDAVKLKETFEKAAIFTPCIIHAYQAIQEAGKAAWIGELKSAAKDKDAEKASQIIKTILRPDFITAAGEMVGIDWRFKEHHNTVSKLFDNIGLPPHQNKDFLRDTIATAHESFVAGYSVRMITAPDEISRIYAIADGFDSCMTGTETPARIYQPYMGERQSLALHVLEHDGDFIARFVVRLKSKKYATVYTGESSSRIENILSALGYERNPSCFIGGRLPLKTDSDNSIFMPYIDGTEKEIRLITTPKGDYLQIGGTRGEVIGDSTGTRGKLKPNAYAVSIGFNYGDNMKDYSDYYQDEENDHDNEFYCSHCEEWCNDDTANYINGENVCDYCVSNNFSQCEDCDNYSPNDDSYYIECYDFQSDDTESKSVCNCCIENYYEEPVRQAYYFYIPDLKRHVLGS